MTEAVSVEKRVAGGLYRLCSSAGDRTIAHLFALGRSTVNMIYKEHCLAVIENLADEWLKMIPPADMHQHIREFFAVTGFPQAIGALDGCHFPVSPPKEHASDYHNYKGWYSIILLALVDHRYRFRYVSVGTPGRCHDASVYGRSSLKRLVESQNFQRPAVTIEGVSVPPVILCDQAFALTANLQKPYPNASPDSSEAAYNYNLSKTRRIVDNAFGRQKARFRFLMKRMECTISTATLAIRASCVLHNICEDFGETIDQQWEEEAALYDTVYVQPASTTDAQDESGRAVRAALAKHFFARNV
ncbi:unnamed protein product [Ixodes hexagonus]